MAQTTSAVTHQLDDTRERIADTVKGIRDTISDRAHRTAEEVGQTVSSTMREPRRAIAKVTDNPLGLAIGAAALGFLVGTLAPGTRLEDRTVGETADEAKQGLGTAGHEAVARGKELASEAIDEVRSALTHADEDDAAQAG